jgi:hypothetical protein
MEIIKHGVVTKYKAMCNRCKCEFIFTQKDTKTYPALGEEWAECPDCGYSIDIEGCEQIDNK